MIRFVMFLFLFLYEGNQCSCFIDDQKSTWLMHDCIKGVVIGAKMIHESGSSIAYIDMDCLSPLEQVTA